MYVKSNLFLLLMLISYSIVISLIYCEYNQNKSLSNIICKPNNKFIILFFMLLMGFFTLIYENIFEDNISYYIILILLINIYGLIIFDVDNIFQCNIHYFFALFSFLSILSFMIYHSFNINSKFLHGILVLYIGFSILMVVNEKMFFLCECCIVILFAIFYLYLHYINRNKI